MLVQGLECPLTTFRPLPLPPALAGSPNCLENYKWSWRSARLQRQPAHAGLTRSKAALSYSDFRNPRRTGRSRRSRSRHRPPGLSDPGWPRDGPDRVGAAARARTRPPWSETQPEEHVEYDLDRNRVADIPELAVHRDKQN